jgi:hypothetical protein
MREPCGLCFCDGSEVHQLFVGSRFYGTGVAAALLQDAEKRLLEANVETAWLACAIGNERAAAFYRKHGWSRVGVKLNVLQLTDRRFPLEIWRFENASRLTRRLQNTFVRKTTGLVRAVDGD